MKTSDNGIKHLIELEGLRTEPYKDVKGFATEGVGHLMVTSGGRPIEFKEYQLVAKYRKVFNEADARALLAEDLKIYEAAVNEAINVDLTQNQFDALVSLCFNIGCRGFKASSVVKAVNNNPFDYVTIVKAWMLWNKPRVLVGRRIKETIYYKK